MSTQQRCGYIQAIFTLLYVGKELVGNREDVVLRGLFELVEGEKW